MTILYETCKRELDNLKRSLAGESVVAESLVPADSGDDMELKLYKGEFGRVDVSKNELYEVYKAAINTYYSKLNDYLQKIIGAEYVGDKKTLDVLWGEIINFVVKTAEEKKETPFYNAWSSIGGSLVYAVEQEEKSFQRMLKAEGRAA